MTDAGDIWIKELPAGPLARLTFDPGRDFAPGWSPDGRRVTFLSDRAGSLSIWSKRADGVGDPELLSASDRPLASAFWDHQGEWLIFRPRSGGGVSRDILGLRPGTDSSAIRLVVSDFDENAPDLSPDGRWLAYTSDESGQEEVYVRPFPEVDSGRWLVSDGGAIAPRWAHSGGVQLESWRDGALRCAT